MEMEYYVQMDKAFLKWMENNRKFTLSTIYKSNITAEDAIKIVNKHRTSISLNDRPLCRLSVYRHGGLAGAQFLGLAVQRRTDRRQSVFGRQMAVRHL